MLIKKEFSDENKMNPQEMKKLLQESIDKRMKEDETLALGLLKVVVTDADVVELVNDLNDFMDKNSRLTETEVAKLVCTSYVTALANHMEDLY